MTLASFLRGVRHLDLFYHFLRALRILWLGGPTRAIDYNRELIEHRLKI